MEINWQQFGLRSNPYDTHPLVEGSAIRLKDVFIGRENELLYLKGVFDSDENACLSVCGDTGVGKTSLINFQKLLSKEDSRKSLFSCRREMEATDTLLNKKSFLLEIIGSVIREIALTDPDLLRNPVLEKLNSLVDFTQMMSLSAGISADLYGFGGGVNFSKEKNNSFPEKITMSSIEGHFFDLLNFIKTQEIGGNQYKGLVVHVNNFDVVLSDSGNQKSVVAFFEEIRDILQTKDVYFIFLGPADFYSSVISVKQRVKSIFVRTPLMVKPLSKKEVVRAFDKRMENLRSDDVLQYFKPIPDEVVFQLHSLYRGDIRSIMTGIKDILGQCADRLLQPLSKDEALMLLGRDRWERASFGLTNEQKRVVEFFVKNKNPATNTEVSIALEKRPSNISAYFSELKSRGIIEIKKTEGKKIFYGLSVEYEPLRWWSESGNKIRESVYEKAKQQPFDF